MKKSNPPQSIGICDKFKTHFKSIKLKQNETTEELKRVEYYGDNSQIIAPHTGQPAFTVPMGFTTGNIPAGLQFLGRMYTEPTLIKLVYAFEQGTKHRVPPTIKK